jgi:hypothetical protein
MIHDDEVAPMFLGLDGSTQALKASLLTSTLDVRRELAVNFDADLPHYKTKGGVHHGPDGQVPSPVEMVIEAFDVLFGRMKEQGWPLSEVRGIAAAGQVSPPLLLGASPSLVPIVGLCVLGLRWGGGREETDRTCDSPSHCDWLASTPPCGIAPRSIFSLIWDLS